MGFFCLFLPFLTKHYRNFLNYYHKSSCFTWDIVLILFTLSFLFWMLDLFFNFQQHQYFFLIFSRSKKQTLKKDKIKNKKMKNKWKIKKHIINMKRKLFSKSTLKSNFSFFFFNCATCNKMIVWANMSFSFLRGMKIYSKHYYRIYSIFFFFSLCLRVYLFFFSLAKKKNVFQKDFKYLFYETND